MRRKGRQPSTWSLIQHLHTVTTYVLLHDPPLAEDVRLDALEVRRSADIDVIVRLVNALPTECADRPVPRESRALESGQRLLAALPKIAEFQQFIAAHLRTAV